MGECPTKASRLYVINSDKKLRKRAPLLGDIKRKMEHEHDLSFMHDTLIIFRDYFQKYDYEDCGNCMETWKKIKEAVDWLDPIV